MAFTAGICTLLIAPLSALAAGRSILVLGDSLSAAYGLEAKQGWVALLPQRLSAQGYGYEVVNASVSGETSDGGLARLPRALQLHHPDVVILELGGNDGLRGLPVTQTRANLEKMIELAQAAGAQVLLVGIQMPPNYGPKYTAAFAAVFPQLARDRHVALVPFLLENVALAPGLMQEDGLHPTAQGEPRVLDTVWKSLQPLLHKKP
jgi:acyl-CoA thioesterase I